MRTDDIKPGNWYRIKQGRHEAIFYLPDDARITPIEPNKRRGYLRYSVSPSHGSPMWFWKSSHEPSQKIADLAQGTGLLASHAVNAMIQQTQTSSRGRSNQYTGFTVRATVVKECLGSDKQLAKWLKARQREADDAAKRRKEADKQAKEKSALNKKAFDRLPGDLRSAIEWKNWVEVERLWNEHGS